MAGTRASNLGVLRFVANAGSRQPRGVPDSTLIETEAYERPSDVDPWQLGTHPDLVEYFEGLANSLPARCFWVLRVGKPSRRGVAPILRHPTTLVIFGLAGGTDTLAFRLPGELLAGAQRAKGYGKTLLYPDARLESAMLGADWSFARPFDPTNQQLVAAAYTFAGEGGAGSD